MHVAEVIMLIVGAILFTASFVIPEKKNKKSTVNKEETRRLIRELMDEEVGKVKFEIEEASEDCVSDNKEKMERALDRIANEKMSAIDEYSNTVLEQIHKNHEETMFLYDMLNNKHSQVKTTAAEVSQLSKTVKSVAATVNVAEKPVEQETKTKTPADSGFGFVSPGKTGLIEGQGFGFTDKSVKTEEKVVSNKVSDDKKEKTEVEFEPINVEKVEIKENIQPAPQPAKKKSSKTKSEKVPVADTNVDLMFASDSNSANNNDKILALHKEGKSNMAIAKELGLGIGEVKLVIDLFEGI